MDNDNNKDVYVSKQPIGGFDTANLLFGDTLISKKNTVRLSFEIFDILQLNDEEILKISFVKHNGLITRVMKYTTDDGKPAITFDMVDDIKKEIIMTSDKEYIGAIGIEGFFFKSNLITQWEIPIFLKLCRAFLLGDTQTFHTLITQFHLRFSKESESRLKSILGII